MPVPSGKEGCEDRATIDLLLAKLAWDAADPRRKWGALVSAPTGRLARKEAIRAESQPVADKLLWSPVAMPIVMKLAPSMTGTAPVWGYSGRGRAYCRTPRITPQS